MGGELMTFPETVEEFMDQYKIVDREQIYTNGAELVPVFRMMQWVEHCREKLQEAENLRLVVTCGECVHCIRQYGWPGEEPELWCDGRGWPRQMVTAEDFCSKGKKGQENG